MQDFDELKQTKAKCLRDITEALPDQVDFFCEKVVLLADAYGVTKHQEE